MDTLAVQLTLPTTKRVVDFHHQAIAHGGRTTKKAAHGGFSVWIILQSLPRFLQWEALLLPAFQPASYCAAAY